MKTVEGIEFDTVLHAVDDLGLDPEGGSDIMPSIRSAYGDGVLIEFPPGEYFVGGPLEVTDNSGPFGILGLGSSRNDVRFTFGSGHTWMFLIRDGHDNIFKNFTWDTGQTQEKAVGNFFIQRDGLKITNVEHVGHIGKNSHPGPLIGPYITERDGHGVIERFKHSTPSFRNCDYPCRRIPIQTSASPAHLGVMEINDCHIEGAGEHSLYCSRHGGTFRVNGGLFKNNDNTNMRIATGPGAKRSWIKGATIVVAPSQYDGPGYWQTARAIRVESGPDAEVLGEFSGLSGLLIEDCDILYNPGARHEISVIGVEKTYGATTIRNTRIENNGSPPSISVQPPQSHVDTPHDVEVDGVHFTGSSSSPAIDASGSGRQVTVRDVCIDMPNSPDSEQIQGATSVTGVNRGECQPPDLGRGVVPPGGDDGTEEPEPPASDRFDNVLKLTGSGEGFVGYLVRVRGDVEGISRPPGAFDAEDFVYDEGDGIFTVIGITGPGGTDTIGYSGEVIAMKTSRGSLTLELDGGEVTAQDLISGSPEDGGLDFGPSGDTLTVESNSLSLKTYTVIVDGDIERVTEGTGHADVQDFVTTSDGKSRITGFTILSGADEFIVNGTIERIVTSSPEMTFTLDGEEVPMDEVAGQSTNGGGE